MTFWQIARVATCASTIVVAAMEGTAAWQPRVDAGGGQAGSRRGAVRLMDRAFADANGPWLAVGATCFWCGWGYLHDRPKLQSNLGVLSGRVDYIRALALVGPGGGWDGRAIRADDVLKTEMVAGLTDAAYARGLRVQWTIFGGVDTTPTPASRRRIVERVIEQLRPRVEKVQFVEIANEGYQNGFAGEAGRQELAALAGLVRAALPVEVALTAGMDARAGSGDRSASATITTVHVDRDVSGPQAMFRPILGARERVGERWVNNEPIGPQSSVRADDDPARILLAAAYTWLCNGAGYVYHTGAGIRGGARDLERGRAADFRDVPNLEPVLQGLAALRRILPGDLPNWSWQDANSRFAKYPFALPHEAGGTRSLGPSDQLLAASASVAPDGRFVVVPVRVAAPVRLTAVKAMTFRVHDVMSLTATVNEVRLAAGETYVLQPTTGAVIVGRLA
jgi:hypothetical protein